MTESTHPDDDQTPENDLPTAPTRSTAVVARTASEVATLSTFGVQDDAWTLARRMASTEFVPKAFRDQPYKVMACILAGHEAGVTPMQSLSKIHVIEGKPAISAELMRGLVQAAGHNIHIEEMTATRCVITGTRFGDDRPTSVEFTMDDAKRAKLDGKAVWRQYPADMLLARATARLCRAAFADVLAGLSHTVEELSDGEFVDSEPPTGEAAVATHEAAAPPKKKRTTKRKAVTPPDAAPSPDAPAAASTPTAAPARPKPPLPGENAAPAPAAEDDESDIVDAEVVEETPPAAAPEPEPAAETITGPSYTGPQIIAMRLADLGVKDRAHRLAIVGELTGRVVESTSDLAPLEVRGVLDALNADGAADTVARVPAPTAEARSERPSADADPVPEQPADDDGQPVRLTADEWRHMLHKHKVKVGAALKHVAETLGHVVPTLDDVVALADTTEVDRWLADWIKGGGRS